MKKIILLIAAMIPLSSIYSMHHEGMSGDNPFILIARIQVKPGMVEDYLEIANDVDLITKQEEPGCLCIILIRIQQIH